MSKSKIDKTQTANTNPDINKQKHHRNKHKQTNKDKILLVYDKKMSKQKKSK